MKDMKNESSESAAELVSKLQVIASNEGCSVEDLVAKHSGEKEEGEESEGGESNEKVNMISARLKAKYDQGGEA